MSGSTLTASIVALRAELDCRVTTPDDAPGSAWNRLVAVEARFDPTNLVRLNHNITPP